MEEILNVLVEQGVETIIMVLGLAVSLYILPAIRKELIPFLKDKRIYDYVVKFVEAAEKMADAGIIEKVDKKAKVIALLETKGIIVTDAVDALIEAAVMELDLMTTTFVEAVLDED